MALFSGGRGGLQKRVAESLQALPSWQITVGSRWVCPFCLLLVKVRDQTRLAAAVDHLDECASFAAGQGVERPLKELKRFAAYRRLRRHVKHSLLRKPTWQLINVTRQWVCPYCASATSIRIPTSSRMDDETLSALVDHVESCPDYARGKGKVVVKPL